MRQEKELLVDEVSGQLNKSDYVYLANYNRITVSEVSSLRDELAKEEAEFHVVKNSILRVALKKLELPDLDEWLTGPTAIIVGGENPSGVAKVLKKFAKKLERPEIKVGVLSKKTMSSDEVSLLAELPSLEALRGQLLGLLQQPAQSMLFVLNGVPSNLLNVLQAKAKEE
ncbi:MAG: 50S ribosomal protein L10 [Opitutaceae bacterium]|nr:50S ribosomal protein L10 [Opitutaceae bacterium]